MGTTIGVCSLGGAPGVTTLATALASMWPTEAPTVLVEADAAGGTLAAWRSMPTDPGLVELAAAARHAPDSSFVPQRDADPLAHSQSLPGGLRVCLAPVTADRAGGVVRLLAEHPHALRPEGEAVAVMDLGRMVPRAAAAHLAAACDAVVVATSEDVAHLKRTRESLPGLRSGIRRVGVAVVGHREPQRQIVAALGEALWAHIPLDERGAALVRGQRFDPHPERRRLMVAAHRLAQRLARELTQDNPYVEEPQVS